MLATVNSLFVSCGCDGITKSRVFSFELKEGKSLAMIDLKLYEALADWDGDGGTDCLLRCVYVSDHWNNYLYECS